MKVVRGLLVAGAHVFLSAPNYGLLLKTSLWSSPYLKYVKITWNLSYAWKSPVPFGFHQMKHAAFKIFNEQNPSW